MKLKELQEKSGREVTKVIKKESKKQVTFVCNTWVKSQVFRNIVSGIAIIRYIYISYLRSGGKNLRDTSAYPRSFGDHVALLHKNLMAAGFWKRVHQSNLNCNQQPSFR